MKKDIFYLFQDERVWNSLTQLSDESHSGINYIKSEFKVLEFYNLQVVTSSDSFLKIIKKYEEYSFKESLIKLKKIIKFISDKTFLTNDKKLELYNHDLTIVQKKTLSWYQSKMNKHLTLDMIQNDSQLKEKFDDHCLAFWLNKFNKLIETTQSDNYFSFEDKIYINRQSFL